MLAEASSSSLFDYIIPVGLLLLYFFVSSKSKKKEKKRAPLPQARVSIPRDAPLPPTTKKGEETLPTSIVSENMQQYALQEEPVPVKKVGVSQSLIIDKKSLKKAILAKEILNRPYE